MNRSSSAPPRKKSTATKPRRVKAKKAPAARAQSGADLKERISKLQSLLDIAKAMTAERDLDSLLRLILGEAVRVVGADRCTLWVVDRDRNELWTKVAQGLEKEQIIRIPIGVGIAGQVASTGQVINIPDAYADPRFNRDVDRDTGYRTRNILGVPMRYTTGEVTGVLQALNKLKGTAFDAEDEELLMALGANAAAAIENAILYEEIGRLFEGFVHASVVAIESRDPTTSGHSERVAKLTLGLAEATMKREAGPYAGLKLSSADMREIRYAALLHDFGKVGVREPVLVKANKLYPGELELIQARFRILMLQRELASMRTLLDGTRQSVALPPDFAKAIAEEQKEIAAYWAFIQQCNQPTVLAEGGFDRLHNIGKITFAGDTGEPHPLLDPVEIERLSIPRGSLDANERLEIESHVTHTFRFLSQIPWTRDLRRVPEIAYAHHEKLDGQGYPRQLLADQIPVQSRMMTIADIYDALTAADRPYKRAVPHDRALNILEDEMKQGKLDRALLTVFIEAQIPQTVLTK